LLLVLLQWLLSIRWPGLADLGPAVQGLGGILALLFVLIRKFSGSLNSLAEKFANLKQAVDAEITRATVAETENVMAAEHELAASAAKVEKAKTLVQATGELVVAALKEYAEETGTPRLRRFVRARAGAEGYGKHLGLVSTIRKDFEELESLMLRKDEEPAEHLEQARKQYEARVHALIEQAGEELEKDERDQLLQTAESARAVPIPATMEFRRIVLYIDDLDRCEPDKVVEVLQAVNMLLSFQLFVVMVAVDARWLSRSLEKRYPDFFGLLKASTGRNNTEAHHQAFEEPDEKKRIRGALRATAADYLEKIFQIPYWVPPMRPKASAALVNDLVASDRITAAAVPAPRQPKTPPQPGEVIVPADEDEQVRTSQSVPPALGLTNDEIETLAALSPFLGGSPRRARRFVNVYRVAKASLTPDEITQLERVDHRALATQLAIATGAPNAFGGWIEACAVKTDGKIAEFVPELTDDETEAHNIRGAWNWFRAQPSERVSPMDLLVAQSDRAARFSFVVPRRTFETEAPSQK